MEGLNSQQSWKKGQVIPMESVGGLCPSQTTDRAQLAHTDSVSPLTHSITAEATTMTASEDNALPLGQAIELYPKFVGYCLALVIVVVGYGYDLTIVGSMIGVESFQRDYGSTFEGRLIIPASWLAAWQAATPLGMAFGSLFGGWLQDRIGRKLSLMIGSVIVAVGVTIIFLSYLPPNRDSVRAMFFVGKLIQGFAVGILKVTAMTYISENAPTSMRGSAMGLFPAANLCGQLCGAIVTYVVNNVEGRVGYLGAFGSQWGLAVAPFILSLFIPESPSYLLVKGENEKAAAMAHRLFAPRVDPRISLQAMKASIEEDRLLTRDASYIGCFNATNRRRTGIAIMANLYPALFGLELIARASYFLQLLGMKSSTSLLLLIGGVVAGIVANGIGIWFLSQFGRRRLAITSLLGATVLWAAIGIAGIWSTMAVAYFVAVALLLTIIVCGMGVWGTSYAIMGEVSSLAMRAKTQALGSVVQQGSSAVMSVILPYAYNPDAGDLKAKSGFIYVGTCALAVGLTWLIVPEMKGRTVGEIDQMFSQNVPVREFKKWKAADESA